MLYQIKCRNFALNMRYFLIFITILLAFANSSNAQLSTYNTVPLHEIRAVWLTTIGGIDWPHSYAQSQNSIRKQQRELCDILDQLHDAGTNTILLQTRIRATTIYESDMEPWDGCTSGFPGKSPGYDPLAFAIEECHKRGMQLHAWVVTIPVGKWNATGCKNLRSRIPNLLKKIGEDGFMNPEQPGTGDYLAKICSDITRRYDIDGIHLDYIRYPETWGRICPDARTKRQNLNKGREFITGIVRKIHHAVKSEKPWVMMSCSPVGKYADLPRQTSGGWNARDAVAQDAVSWLNEGLMDAIFPMMYFRGKNFYPFAMDWQQRAGGKFVVPGLGIYFMHPKEKNWPLIDITREMYFLRQANMGYCFFRSKFFTDNTKGLYNFTKDEFCPYPALVPPMTWYGFRQPDAPASIELVPTNNSDVFTLTWSDGKDNSDGNYLRYNVYASEMFTVNTSDARNIIAAGTTCHELRVIKGMTYAVTAVDRYGNESQPTVVRLKPKKLSKL